MPAFPRWPTCAAVCFCGSRWGCRCDAARKPTGSSIATINFITSSIARLSVAILVGPTGVCYKKVPSKLHYPDKEERLMQQEVLEQVDRDRLVEMASDLANIVSVT